MGSLVFLTDLNVKNTFPLPSLLKKHVPIAFPLDIYRYIITYMTVVEKSNGFQWRGIIWTYIMKGINKYKSYNCHFYLFDKKMYYQWHVIDHFTFRTLRVHPLRLNCVLFHILVIQCGERKCCSPSLFPWIFLSGVINVYENTSTISACIDDVPSSI